MHRLRARFGGKAFETGDEAFDRGWHIDTSAAHPMIDEDCRETIRDAGCWCRAVYERGAIEVRLDADQLAGAHVLSGIELALVLARARSQTTAYR
jgi:hypothetical protein